MDWYTTVFEVIDMRSFSNLWFWIALAVVWSSASHWVLGVPFDMVTRARRKGDAAFEDLHDIVRVNTSRILYIVSEAGLWLVGLGSGFLTALAVLGFVYQIELAQAIFLLGFPMSGVGLLSVLTSRIIQRDGLQGEDLCRRLWIHRVWTQIIGMIAIFCTALWGMYQNMSLGVLHG